MKTTHKHILLITSKQRFHHFFKAVFIMMVAIVGVTSCINHEPIDENTLLETAIISEYHDAGKNAVEKIKTPELLATIAMKARHHETRLNASDRITDQRLLVKVAANASDVDVRSSALRRITDQSLVGEVAAYAVNSDTRKSAIDKISIQKVLTNIAAWIEQEEAKKVTNPQLLSEMAQMAGNWEIRKIAVEKITDQDLLKKITIDDNNRNVRIAAINQIKDGSLLKEIGQKVRNIHVKKYAIEKAADILNEPELIDNMVLFIPSHINDIPQDKHRDSEKNELSETLATIGLVACIIVFIAALILYFYLDDDAVLWINVIVLVIFIIGSNAYKDHYKESNLEVVLRNWKEVEELDSIAGYKKFFSLFEKSILPYYGEIDFSEEIERTLHAREIVVTIGESEIFTKRHEMGIKDLIAKLAICSDANNITINATVDGEYIGDRYGAGNEFYETSANLWGEIRIYNNDGLNEKKSIKYEGRPAEKIKYQRSPASEAIIYKRSAVDFGIYIVMGNAISDIFERTFNIKTHNPVDFPTWVCVNEQ